MVKSLESKRLGKTKSDGLYIAQLLKRGRHAQIKEKEREEKKKIAGTLNQHMSL